jgi:hypothetical protein
MEMVVVVGAPKMMLAFKAGPAALEELELLMLEQVTLTLDTLLEAMVPVWLAREQFSPVGCVVMLTLYVLPATSVCVKLYEVAPLAGLAVSLLGATTPVP